MDRRDFLKGLVVSTGAIAGHAIPSLLPPNFSLVMFPDLADAEVISRHEFEYRLDGKVIRHKYIFGVETYPQPEMKKPQKGVPFFDQAFGTKITRISDRATDKLKPRPSKTGSLMQPAYPRHNYDNADGSLLLFNGSYGSGQVVYDASSFKLIKALSTKAVNWSQPVEPRWDAHNPELLYYHYSPPTALSVYNVRTDSYKIIHDFKQEYPEALSIGMSEEGDCSSDSRYFAFLVRSQRGGDKWAHRAIVCYDRVSDRVVGKLDLPIPGFEKQGGGNWVGMSPSGEHVLIGTAPMLVYDREFRKPPVRLTHGGGWHCDVGLDDDGREVIVYAGGLKYSPGGQSDGRFAMCDLKTGTETILTGKTGSGIEMHFDCSCVLTPGWGLVSTYHAAPKKQGHWMEYAIFLLELTRRKNPPPRIWRICHTHANRGSYVDDPFATFDRFGGKIFFGSNWGVPANQGGDIDVYQVELPPGWYENLMGTGKSTRLRNIAADMLRKKW